MATKTVFLSTTARDLTQHRDAAYKAIEGLDGYHCVRMEDFGARDWEADDFCREKVAECDLFVGVVGHLYGASPEGSEQSYTEREYEAAIAEEVPRLMFIATEDISLPLNLRETDEKWARRQRRPQLCHHRRSRRPPAGGRAGRDARRTAGDRGQTGGCGRSSRSPRGGARSCYPLAYPD